MNKSKLPIIFLGIAALVGVGVLLYPSLSRRLNEKNQTLAVQNYVEQVERLDEDARQKAWDLARAYNERYFAGAVSSDLYESAPPSPYEEVMNLDGIMGYLEIPVLDLFLPIYHGTGDSVLQRGVGHIPQTALPTGGQGYHPVLTSHRAESSARLFTDLDQVAAGDVFLLHILGEALCYEVDQIRTVLPSNVEDLLPTPGEDYVTLVTCTPYSINSHRLLVRGRRIDYTPDMPIPVREVQPALEDRRHIGVVIGFVGLWSIILAVFAIRRLGHKRRDRVLKKRK